MVVLEDLGQAPLLAFEDRQDFRDGLVRHVADGGDVHAVQRKQGGQERLRASAESNDPDRRKAAPAFFGGGARNVSFFHAIVFPMFSMRPRLPWTSENDMILG